MLRLIDLDRWERRSHFEYYTQSLQCGYSITAGIDVTELLRGVHRNGLRFYPSFLYCICSVVNETKEFRMGLNAEGMPGIWDEVHPVHTLFHEDDKTFSDIWSFYSSDFQEFYRTIEADTAEYKEKKGIKTKPGQPPNFFCVSCTPWLRYEGYGTYAMGGRPNLFPIVTFGKYEEENGRQRLPLTVTISHAAADGYHTSMFFSDLQKKADQLFAEK